MELNGITCLGYQQFGSVARFDLDCDFDAVEAIDGQELKVTSDGDDVAVFGGYELTGLEKREGFVRATFAKGLEPNTAQDISAIHQTLAILQKAAETADRKAVNAQSSANTANTSAGEANTLANANAEAIEELAAAVFTE